MERKIWPKLQMLLARERVFGCAVYDIKPSSPDGVEFVGIWNHDLLQLGEASSYWETNLVQRTRASELLKLGENCVFRYADAALNDVGEKWWEFVIAAGPARRSGVILCCLIAAKDAAAVGAVISRIQRVLQRGKN